MLAIFGQWRSSNSDLVAVTVMRVVLVSDTFARSPIVGGGRYGVVHGFGQ